MVGDLERPRLDFVLTAVKYSNCRIRFLPAAPRVCRGMVGDLEHLYSTYLLNGMVVSMQDIIVMALAESVRWKAEVSYIDTELLIFTLILPRTVSQGSRSALIMARRILHILYTRSKYTYQYCTCLGNLSLIFPRRDFYT